MRNKVRAQLSELFYGEGEVGVWEWFVAQGEVPPFGGNGFESVCHHGFAQNHSVGELLGCDAPAGGAFGVVAGVASGVGIAAKAGVAFGAEPVECAAHVHFFPGSHVKQGEVDG